MSAQFLGAAYAGQGAVKAEGDAAGAGPARESAADILRKRKAAEAGIDEEAEGEEDEEDDDDGNTGSENEEDDDEDDAEERDDEEEEGAAARMSARLFAVRSHLQRMPGHPFVSFAELDRDLQIDLHMDEELLERLQKSEMIKVDVGAEKIKFEPRFDVHDIPSLLRALEKHSDGISVQEIEASGPVGVITHVHKAIVWGLVIAIRNRNAASGTAPYVLFPRGPSFLVPLSGEVTAEPGRSVLRSTCDLQDEVHRGDALLLGRDAVDAFVENELPVLEQRCLRVSTEPLGAPQPHAEREYAAVLERLERKQVLSSRSSINPPRPPPEGDYKVVFTDAKVPVFPSIKASSTLENVAALKHGCTNDVKALWRDACAKHQYRAGASAMLDRLLTENNLTTAERLAQSGQATRKRKVRLGSKPKRRNNRARKITNAHLDD